MHLVKKAKTQFDNNVETQFQEYIQNTILEKKSPYSLSRIKCYGWMDDPNTLNVNYLKEIQLNVLTPRVIEGNNTLVIHRVKY